MPNTVEIPSEILRTLFDVAVNSLDFGSGFWDQDDTDAARATAVLLGVCPMVATPGDMRPKYPECPGITKRAHSRWTHTDHV